MNINTELPLVKPKIKIGKETRKRLLGNIEDKGQVIVHCTFRADSQEDELIRIWRTTFLCSQQSSHKSKLLHKENITYYPMWTFVIQNTTHSFTLIFEGLPKSCSSFDFIEEIPQPGGFEIKNIQRNKTDVYRIRIK